MMRDAAVAAECPLAKVNTDGSGLKESTVWFAMIH